MASIKESAEHTEYMEGNVAPPARRGGRVKRHCAKFWWLHIIIFIAISLIIILPVIYVGYPHIAQSDINSSNIHTTLQIIRNATPNNTTLTIEGVLLTNSIFHPTLYAFNASLYLKGHDLPFTTFTVPTMKGKNGTTFQVNQTVDIVNLDETTQYAVAVLANETVPVTLKATGGLKLGGLPYTTVHYNQAVNVPGMNSLKGFNVTELHLSTNASLPYHANAHGNVTVPNLSTSEIDMGDATLDLHVDDVFIGNATLPGLFLASGSSTYPAYATIDLIALGGVLSKPQYKCGVIPVHVKGNSSIVDGVRISFLSASVQALDQVMSFDLKPSLTEAGLGSLANGTCAT